MKFTTSDIPQADRIEKVMQTVEAVNEGAVTENQIAEAIGFTDRQARYYRHAAEVLGFIINKSNNATVTETGKELANSNLEFRKTLLTKAIFQNSLFKEIIKYFEQNELGVSEDDAKSFLLTILDNDAHATVSRRIKTVLSWLEYIEVIIESDESYKYNDKLELSFELDENEEGAYPANYSQELDIKEDKFSVFELIRKITQDKVIMNPDFQRNLVWKQYQKSQFIESIILNIPLPPLYFKKELDGKYIIIDGLQRTSTLKSFLNPEDPYYFALEGLKALKKLNGKHFHELEDAQKSRIEDKSLFIYMVQPAVPMVVVYDIFNRINTSGTKLDRQEIRNCIFIGESTKLLKRLSESTEFTEGIGNGISSTRMKDREAILRCLAFDIFDFIKDYNNSLDDILEKTMKSLNKMSETKITALESNFLRVMRLTNDFFGRANFRYPTEAGRGRINIALMESVYKFFSVRDDSTLLVNKNKIQNNFELLLQNSNYFDSIRYSTGSSLNVKTRFEIAEQILGNY